MKKLLILVLIGSLYVSCNSNPQQTGSDIIMEKERHDNPIEYQTKAIESTPQPATTDTAALAKNQSDSAK